MKNLLAIILVISTVSFAVLDIFFENKTKDYEKKNIILSKSSEELKKISDMNKWFIQNVLSDLSNHGDSVKTQNDILEYIENINQTFKTDIQTIDKKEGILRISLKSRIPRNEVENMVKLLKVKIPNGFLDLKKVIIDRSYLNVQFDLIGFYKE